MYIYLDCYPSSLLPYPLSLVIRYRILLTLLLSSVVISFCYQHRIGSFSDIARQLSLANDPSNAYALPTLQIPIVDSFEKWVEITTALQVATTKGESVRLNSNI